MTYDEVIKHDGFLPVKLGLFDIKSTLRVEFCFKYLLRCLRNVRKPRSVLISSRKSDAILTGASVLLNIFALLKSMLLNHDKHDRLLFLLKIIFPAVLN